VWGIDVAASWVAWSKAMKIGWGVKYDVELKFTPKCLEDLGYCDASSSSRLGVTR
jgi:hypothetical protein